MERPIPKRFRHASKVLCLSMLIMGGCGIIYEYTLGVLGNNLMGSSHEQIFVVIGIMLFAMGVGAAVQRRIVGDLIDKFVAIELLLGVLGGIATLAVYTSFVWTVSYQLFLFGFAFIIGALIGLEIPVAIRINTEYSKSLRINLSDILSMDYVGSLLGALLFTYVLLNTLSVGRIGIALGVVNTLLAMGVLAFFWPLVRRKRLLASISLLCLGTLCTGFAYADRWTAYLEQRCYADPIVYRETTKYQHLVLTRRGDVVNFYINGHLQFSSRDEAIYHELLVHVPMALVPRRKRVLILGGGDGLALREVLRYGDVENVTLVDIDPAVTRLASSHADLIRLNEAAFHDVRVCTLSGRGVLPGERMTVSRKTKLASQLLDQTEYDLAEVRVFNIDADLFIQDLEESFDIVVLDFPDPKLLELAKLFSVDFYRALSRRLSPGAVVSIQATSPYFTKKAFLCVGKSLQTAGFQVLPYHEDVPSFGEWGWYIAWREGADPATMRSRIQALDRIPVETQYLTPDLVRAAFVFGKGWLEGMDEVQANTKMRPALIRYYTQSWN